MVGDFCGAAFLLWLLDWFSFFIFCPTAFALMASLPSNVDKWPALSSTTATGCYGPFAVLEGGLEGLQPDPHHLCCLVDHSLLYDLPPVVVSTEPHAVAHLLVAPLPSRTSGGPGIASPVAATDF